METSKLLTMGIIGLGLYLLYEWMVSQCETPGSVFYGGGTCQALIGTPIQATAAATSTTSTTAATGTTSAATTTAAPAQTAAQILQSQLIQAAGFSQTNPADLTPDQWSYYYNNLPGKTPIPSTVFENILTALGLTDASRGTPVTVAQFVAAANQNGISGLRFGYVPMSAIHGGLHA